MRFSLPAAKHVLIVGGSGAIAKALIAELARDASRRIVVTTTRVAPDAELAAIPNVTVISVEPLVEPQLAALAERLKTELGHLDLLINCAGVLHDSVCQPEKSLRQIELSTLQHVFAINTFIAPLLAKHLQPLFRRSHVSVFASLSAKVGSIGDNALGGWYAYRASKAALNMMMKTIALEYQRHHCPTIVIPLHPGTTRSALSRPFTAETRPNLHDASETASNLLGVIGSLTLADSGTFCNWDGSKLPW